MRLHERERLVSTARSALLEKLSDWATELVEDGAVLTPSEEASVLTEVLSTALAGVFKYEIRYERHPLDADAKGGEHMEGDERTFGVIIDDVRYGIEVWIDDEGRTIQTFTTDPPPKGQNRVRYQWTGRYPKGDVPC